MNNKVVKGVMCGLFSTCLLVACDSKKPNDPSNTDEENISPIPTNEKTPLRLWYDEEVQKINEGSSSAKMSGGGDIGWERWSLPLGNGYFGVNVFGRTETERIQITEKTLSNPWRINGKNNETVEIGGLNNFSETYLDFEHSYTNVSDYYRYLDVRNAISGVSYKYKNVTYNREYFTSYPDKALVIYLNADKDGAVNFTLRPTIPYKQSYMVFEGDQASKEGQVISKVENGVGYIELSGKLGYYDVDFLGLYKVYIDGGNMTASTAPNIYQDRDGSYHVDSNGTIEVKGANKAFIVVTLGTDYELSSEIFTSRDRFKPTAFTTLDYTRVKVEGYMDEIDSLLEGKDFDKSYQLLKERHINDYQELFNRVEFTLDYNQEDITLTTDQLLRKYQTGYNSAYLEMLIYQYSRYLLIASSRPGALPANLQGTWNAYNVPPWSSGYWHNINIQMNYWSAFSTNLAETFEPYVDYNKAYMKQAETNASNLVFQNNRNVYNNDGGNGWTIGVANNPFFINSDRSSGNMGFTTQIYWDYYQYTKDKEVLKMVYDILANAARYVTKCVKLDKDGHYLVESSDSPEQYVNGQWYYTTGTTYAQSFSYLNNYYALQAAKDMGVDLTDKSILSTNDYSILNTIMEQLDKYDPINIGLSGQIKEFREEDYYGSLGDPGHRHISQLVGLCPGTLINSLTPAWIDAAKVTLAGRDDQNNMGPALEQVGWSFVHRIGLYARTKDGNMAYKMLHELANKQMTTNLLTLCGNVFQIEAILGTSATMTEMLLQSHEGYIDLLPAIPKEWKEGSINGILARGNFEMGLKWSDGFAKEVKVLSNNGEVMKLSYPSIDSVIVTRDDGEVINYHVDGNNLISFETEKGRTYTINNFVKQNKPSKVADFKYTRENLGAFNFSWNQVDEAVSYKVYKAIENQPTYTYIGSTTTNSLIYAPNKEEENARTTFCVVAVNNNGRESDRATCFYNPKEVDAKINDVSWNVLSNGKLQVVVDANEKTYKYRLYEAKENSSKYVVVDESIFPILGVDHYNDKSVYAVTAASYYTFDETPMYFLNKSSSENVFLGKKFVPTEESKASEFNNDYNHDCLTDGIFEENKGRYSSKYNGTFNATIDLGGQYSLSQLKLYVYASSLNYAGQSMLIEAYMNDNWTVVCNIENNSGFSPYKTDNAIVIDLDNIVTNTIRISIPHAVDGYTISYHEFECLGFKVNGSLNQGNENILEGLNASLTGGVSTDIGNINDGNLETYSTVTSENGQYSVVIDLDVPTELYTLNINEYVTGGVTGSTNTKVEVLHNNEWVTVIDGISLDDGNATINIQGILSTKIRITFNNSDYSINGKAASIKEITCTSGIVLDLSELKQALRSITYQKGDLSFVNNETYLKFVSYAKNTNATTSDIEGYISEINAYING